MDRRTTPATSFAVGIWTTQGLVIALLAARRASGAYHGPLPSPALLLAIAIFAAGAAGAAALDWKQTRDRRRSGLLAAGLVLLFAWTAAAGPTTAQVGALLAATLGTIVFSVVLGVDFSAWLVSVQHQDPQSGTESPVAAVEATGPANDLPSPAFVPPAAFDRQSPAADDTAAVCSEEAATIEDDRRTTHAMVRRHEDDADVIEGTVRVTFPAGQRDATVHLTFAPPFAITPAVEFEPVEGDDWEIKVEAAFPYGVRLRVRRDRRELPASDSRLAYHAAAPWSQRNAA